MVKDNNLVNYKWNDDVLDECFGILLKHNKKPSNGWYKRIAEFAKCQLDESTWATRINTILTHGTGVKLEYLTTIYGDKKGLRRWNKYVSKQAETNTLQYKAKNTGGHKNNSTNTTNRELRL